MTKKRGYSHEFTPADKGRRYLLDAIPAALWRDVRAKAKREGVSIRALILSLLQRWLKETPDARDSTSDKRGTAVDGRCPS